MFDSVECEAASVGLCVEQLEWVGELFSLTLCLSSVDLCVCGAPFPAGVGGRVCLWSTLFVFCGSLCACGAPFPAGVGGRVVQSHTLFVGPATRKWCWEVSPPLRLHSVCVLCVCHCVGLSLVMAS